MNEITAQKQQAIELHQKILVSANLAQQNIWDMCNGLKTMRDNKLYKELGYPNFEDYCENEVGMKRRNVYNYISIVEKINAENVQSIAQIGMTKLSLLATISEPEQAALCVDLVFNLKKGHIDLTCSKSETQKSGSTGCITAVQTIKQPKDTAGQGCLIISMLTTKKKTADSTAMLSTVQGYNMKSINIIISLIL